MRKTLRDRESLGAAELLELIDELDAERAAFQSALHRWRRTARKRQHTIDDLWANVPAVRDYLIAKKSARLSIDPASDLQTDRCRRRPVTPADTLAFAESRARAMIERGYHSAAARGFSDDVRYNPELKARCADLLETFDAEAARLLHSSEPSSRASEAQPRDANVGDREPSSAIVPPSSALSKLIDQFIRTARTRISQEPLL